MVNDEGQFRCMFFSTWLVVALVMIQMVGSGSKSRSRLVLKRIIKLNIIAIKDRRTPNRRPLFYLLVFPPLFSIMCCVSETFSFDFSTGVSIKKTNK